MNDHEIGATDLSETEMVRREADDRLVDAMLQSITPSEVGAREDRIRRTLGAIRDEDVSSTSVASISGPWWPRLLGVGGAGLAAAIAIVVVLSIRPEEAKASSWFERAVVAAASMTEGLRSFTIRIVPHDDAPMRDELQGRMLIEGTDGDVPKFRLDIDEPERHRHAMGIDSAGGWQRRQDGPVREFPVDHLARHLTVGGVGLLVDPLPAFLVLVQRDYDVVEMTETPTPRLVARRRQIDGDPMAPRTVEMSLDPETWEVDSLVLKWDSNPVGRGRPQPGPDRRDVRGPRGSDDDRRRRGAGPGRDRTGGAGPGPGRPPMPGDRRPGGSGPRGAGPEGPPRLPGGVSERPMGRPSGPRGDGPPPPPAEIHFVRTTADVQRPIARDSS